MNANELADELDDIPVNDFESLDQHHYTRQAATMLRQQQAEIEALKVRSWEGDSLISKLSEEIEALKGDGKVCARCGAIVYDPVITQTAKTLTDDEIFKTAIENGAYQNKKSGHIYPDDMYILNFARAILRKANEK